MCVYIYSWCIGIIVVGLNGDIFGVAGSCLFIVNGKIKWSVGVIYNFGSGNCILNIIN